MPFPNLEDILLPLLKITKENHIYNTERAIRYIGNLFGLTNYEREMSYTSTDGYEGKILRELVRFGRDFLRGADLIEGFNKEFYITKSGTALLKLKPTSITKETLKSYLTFKEFVKENREYLNTYLLPLEKEILIYNNKDLENNPKNSKTISDKKTKISLNVSLSLEEELEKNYKEIQNDLKINLLAKVKEMSPSAFEELCALILSKLIYEKEDKIIAQNIVKCLGKTGDGGVDGLLIKKDKLKETRIYIQAKCWKDTVVGRPELQKFLGALAGQKAKDGVFITTSKFAATADDFAKKDTGFHITLVDGIQLVDYMIEYEVGVQKIITYEIKTIDTEFFVKKDVKNIAQKNNKF